MYARSLSLDKSDQPLLTGLVGFGTVALNHIQVGKINPNQPIVRRPLLCPCPNTSTDSLLQANVIKGLTFPETPKVRIVSRLTLTLEETSINYNLSNTTKEFDLLAIRPTTEKTLQHACTSMDIDIISLDLSSRLPYYLKHSTLGSATSRGIFLEICYSASLSDTAARRQLLSNAANIVRATRGRGLIISSEATRAMGLRGPYDLINLATFWGLPQERGRETVCENPRKVLVKAETRRGVYKGVLRITAQPDPIPYKRPAPDQAAEGSGQQASGLSKKKQKALRAAERRQDRVGEAPRTSAPVDTASER